MSLVAESRDFLSLWDNAHQDNPLFPQDIPEPILNDLESWSIANSNSFDQSNLRAGRLLMQLLIDRRKNDMRHREIVAGGSDQYSFIEWPGHPREGQGTGHESYTESMRGDDDDKCSTCVFYRTEPKIEEIGICALWHHKVSSGYVVGLCDNYIGNDGNDIPPFEENQGRISIRELRLRFGTTNELRNASRVLLWLNDNNLINFNDRRGATISAQRLGNHDTVLAELLAGATIGLDSKWELYILGRYGGRNNSESAPILVRGSTDLPPVISFDLHIVLGEVVGRLVVERTTNNDEGWGLSQYRIRESLCRLASTEGREPAYVTVEEYYRAFRGGAGHMADTYLFRAAQDNNAATFVMVDADVPPYYGRVLVDPRLMRWHERSRRRAHLVGDDN